MQFIALENFKKMLQRATIQSINGTSVAMTFTDITGTSRTLYQPSGNAYANGSPFYSDIRTTVRTSAGRHYFFARASSDAEISSSAFAPTTEIGSCSCTVSVNSGNNGWTMNITVSGADGDIIKSLYFTKGLDYNSNANYYEAAIFAVKLDTPVELNAENNYTANFTFAIEV